MARAATTSVNGSTPTPTTSTANQVVNPGNATGAPNSTYAQVYPSYNLVLSGFPTTNLGTLNSASLTITYGVAGTRPASGRDTWQVQYSTDGGTNWTTAASGTALVTAPTTTASIPLTGMTWAGLANLRVRAQWVMATSWDTGWYIQLDGATVTLDYTPNATTAGAVTMDGATCGQATVSAAFTDNVDGDGSTSFERGSTASGPWVAASCAAATGASPRQCLDTTSAGTYWYRATFTDPDGVSGSPAISAGSVVITACAGGGGTTITLSNGTDPVGVTTLSPGGAGWLDGFGLSATGANVSSVQVTIPANATALASLFIHSKQACTGGTTYGSIANPVNGANAIATSALSVTGGLPLYVCATAKPHGAVGGAVRVTATVTGVTAAGYTVTGTDATGGILGVDDVAPGAPAGLAGTPGAGAVSLAWTNPSAPDLAAVIVVRDVAAISWTPSDGVLWAEGTTVSGTLQVVCAVTATPSTAGRCYDSSASGGPYYFRAFARDAYGNYSVASNAPTPVTPLAFIPDGDPQGGRETPVVSIINPTGGAVLTLNPNAKVQVRAFSPNARAFVAPGVELLVNGVPAATAPTKSTNYDPTATSGVWEFVLGPADNLAPGTTATLRARATNTALATPIYSTTVRVRIAAAGTLGDGNLLRRDNSSQLCNDCHAVSSHSSETTGTKYGSWSVTCRDCHTPHQTRNVMLVAETITPPSITGQETPRTVVFTNRTGYGAGGYANASFSGPCQVCHTRTSFYSRTADGGHETGPCNQCHGHDKAFRGEGTCASCHLAAPGAADDEDLVYGDAHKTLISQTEWLALGHGRLTTSGAYPSGSAAANFDGQGAAVSDRGCAYCHTNGVGHGVAANFFRLTRNENDSGNVEGLNGTCLKCHGSAAYDSGALPGAGYANLSSTKKVNAAHAGSKHGGLNDSGGQYCWDCHDPHGDRTAGSQDLWYMVQRLPIANSDAGGVPVASIMTPQVIPNPVEFRASLGGGAGLDYVDYVGGGTYPTGPNSSSTTGFCRNCHATVAIDHYTVTESDGHFATALGVTTNSRCTDCHKHRNAFQAQCNTCHASPPNVGKHYGHDEVFAATPTVIPNAYGGTIRTNATQYGFACSACHGGTHINATNAGTSADPYLVDVTFSGGVGAYARAAEAAQQGTDPLQYFGNSNGTCSNTYCHSRATPLDQTGNALTRTALPAPTWTQAAGMSCTSCHDGGGATSLLSSAHRKHTSATGYAYECAKCHVDTVNTGASPTLKDKTRHVDNVKSVGFDSTNPGAQAYVSPTCGTLYCHSNGSPANGTIAYTSPRWNDAAYSTCAECHPTTTGLATNAHGKHLNNSGLLGANYVCADCHANVVAAGNSPVTTPSNHANGTKQVQILTKNGIVSSDTTATCSSTYCHSNGQRQFTTKLTVTWTAGAWGAGTVCYQCHGRTTTTGAPDYGAAGQQDTATANSHAKHVKTASDCAICHFGLVSAAGTAIAGSKHTDGFIDVVFSTTKAGNVTFVKGTYTAPSTYASATCTNVKCHNNNATPLEWGGPAMKCSDCHAGAADTDSFAIGTAGIINTTEWTNTGHGNTTLLGANALPTIAAGQPCLYCHDASVSHQPNTTTNPFRLLGATTGSGVITNGNYSTGTDTAANATCLNCHGTGSAGVNPAGQGVKNGTKKVNSWHMGGDHTTFATNGGRRCWDCHDPHGDANAKMIGKKVVQQPSDLHSFAGTRVPVTGTVAFANTGTDYVNTTTRNGICQVCHTNTTYWRSASEPTAHKTATTDCISCHAHEQPSAPSTAFAGKGGGWDCIGCHGATGQGTTRAVTPDFALQSHHVRTVATLTATGAGTFNSTSTGAGVGNNRDCVVCHAEGQIITANTPDCPSGMTGLVLPSTCTNPSWHGNKRIDLRDVDVAQPAVDSNSNLYVFTYDKAAVSASAGAAANWSSANQTWRVWTSGVSEAGGPDLTGYRAGLDKFCLNCHDADGAAQIASFRVSAGTAPENGAAQRTTTDPFYDGAGNISNTYDQYNRSNQTGSTGGVTTVPPTTGGHVTDIKSKVTCGTPTTCTTAPPAQGTFARHAIRGQSSSKYTKYTGAISVGQTLYDASRFVSRGTDEKGQPNWNDTSVMGCADCHTTDGANGASGNAHGSGSEYLLKDATGGAAEGSYAGGNENCARCHSNYGATHTGGNASDFVDSTSATGGGLGAGRAASNGSIFGLACLNCHGGAQGTGAGTGDTNGFGWIHGTSQVFPTYGSGTRNAYRFMNGSSLRFYVPPGANWDTGAGSCYTLASGTTFGACTKHGSRDGGPGTLVRPLSY